MPRTHKDRTGVVFFSRGKCAVLCARVLLCVNRHPQSRGDLPEHDEYVFLFACSRRTRRLVADFLDVGVEPG